MKSASIPLFEQKKPSTFVSVSYRKGKFMKFITIY